MAMLLLELDDEPTKRREGGKKDKKKRKPKKPAKKVATKPPTPAPSKQNKQVIDQLRMLHARPDDL
jgi:hypothetical protein